METNPDTYSVVFENDRVRVLEYNDTPGTTTQPHAHPDSVMYALSTFRRRLHANGPYRDVEITTGFTGWLPAQEHYGENIGDTPSRAISWSSRTGLVRQQVTPSARPDGVPRVPATR